MLPLLPFVAGLATGVAAIQLWRNKKTQAKFLAIKASAIDAVRRPAKDPEPTPTGAENSVAVEPAAIAPDDVPTSQPTRKRAQKKVATKPLKRGSDTADSSQANT